MSEELTNEQKFSKIHYDGIGMCRCGNPDDLNKFLFRILAAQHQDKIGKITFEQRGQLRKEAFDECGLDTVIEFILHVFDHNGLWEHGVYVGNGWLTEKGREYMKLLHMQISNSFILDDQDYKDLGYADAEGNLISFDV